MSATASNRTLDRMAESAVGTHVPIRCVHDYEVVALAEVLGVSVGWLLCLLGSRRKRKSHEIAVVFYANQSSEPLPRFSARCGAAIRGCFVRATDPVGGSRSTFWLRRIDAPHTVRARA